MSDWWIGVLLRPFVVIAFLFAVYCVKYVIWRLMPDSPLKRRLFSPLGGKR